MSKEYTFTYKNNKSEEITFKRTIDKDGRIWITHDYKDIKKQLDDLADEVEGNE